MMFPKRIILSAMFLVGCTKMCGVSHQDMSPEQVVEAYLDIALNMQDVSQRSQILEYTTGELHSAIFGATEESIRRAYIERKYLLKRFSLMERRDRTPRETEITFLLEYKEIETNNQMKEEDAAVVTTENTVAVIKDKGLWKIYDVLGNKTSIEFPMTEFSKITPGGTSDVNVDEPVESEAVEETQVEESQE
jgi:hypothetical protein